MRQGNQRFPPRSDMRKVYRWTKLGYGRTKIAGLLGYTPSSVSDWVRNPQRFDPVDDEVAIQRALDGDGRVYEALTYYEYESFIERLVERVAREPYCRSVHDDRGAEIYWLHDLESKLGVSTRLRRRVQEEARSRGIATVAT